jgi:hypothetical protein
MGRRIVRGVWFEPLRPLAPRTFNGASRSGLDKTQKESEVMGVEYELSLFFSLSESVSFLCALSLNGER